MAVHQDRLDTLKDPAEFRPWLEVLQSLRPTVESAARRAARMWGPVTPEMLEALYQDVWLELSRNEHSLLEKTRVMSQPAIVSFIAATVLNIVHDHFRGLVAENSSSTVGPADSKSLPVLDRARRSLREKVPLAEIDSILRSKMTGGTGLRDRRMFWLHHRFGMTPDAISESLGLSVGDVKRALEGTTALLQAELVTGFFEEPGDPSGTGAGKRSGAAASHRRRNPDLHPLVDAAERSGDAELERYHALVCAKHLGRISDEESDELAELDRKLSMEGEEDTAEFDRTYSDSRAAKLEAGLKKIDELLAELRRSRAGS